MTPRVQRARFWPSVHIEVLRRGDDARRLANDEEEPCCGAGYDSLISILSSQYKEHIKKTSSVVRRPENIRRCLDRSRRLTSAWAG